MARIHALERARRMRRAGKEADIRPLYRHSRESGNLVFALLGPRLRGDDELGLASRVQRATWLARGKGLFSGFVLAGPLVDGHPCLLPSAVKVESDRKREVDE